MVSSLSVSSSHFSFPPPIRPLNRYLRKAAHMVMWVMSDRGIPRSYRMMQAFGVNTYTLLNAKGERFFVKFHWLPELGVHSLVWDEALKIAGQDPGACASPLGVRAMR